MIFDHFDEIGSATTATDCTGNVVNEKLYYPFGESWTGYALPNLGMHQEFAQLPDYDPETDQYNTANRHYSPMGRWMSPDPGNAGANPSDPQTWNMYAYVRNSPMSLTDASGLDFYLSCIHSDSNASTCQQVQNGDSKAWVQGATVDDPDKEEGTKFEPTVVTQNAGGGLEDQNGNSYAGTFDQSGVHLTSLDGTGTSSGSGQFVQGSKETDLYGAGIYAGVEGKFISACGGSCKARGSLYDAIDGSWAVDRALRTLRSLGSLEVLGHLLSGAHSPGPEWMDSSGLDHVIRATTGVNKGKTELHFEGKPIAGGDTGGHMWDAARGLFSGRAAEQRNEKLP